MSDNYDILEDKISKLAAKISRLQRELFHLHKELKGDRIAETLLRINKFKKDSPHNQGYVYVIRSTKGYYKIGYAKDLEPRLSQIKVYTALDGEIPLIKSFFVENMLLTERYLHEMFFFKRTREKGEWFALNQDDIEWLNQLTDEELNQTIRQTFGIEAVY